MSVSTYKKLLNMAHRNRWFTVLKDGDFPVRYVSLPEGISWFINPINIYEL